MKEDEYTKILDKNQVCAIFQKRDKLFGKAFYPNV